MRCAVLLLVLVAGCSATDVGKPGGKATGPVRLTWRNYTGLQDPSGAQYVLDGVVVGVGSDGFRKALRTIPIGSTITVYPFYPLMAIDEPSGPWRRLPFNLSDLAAWGAANPENTIILSLDEIPKEGRAYIMQSTGNYLPYESMDK